MINSEYVPPEELQMTNGVFSISGTNDSSAFFNMNPISHHQDEQNNFNYYQPDISPFGANPFYSNQRQDQIVTPSAPQNPASGPQCHGNCNACVWSFLCKKASTSFGSLGGNFVPKLG